MARFISSRIASVQKPSPGALRSRRTLTSLLFLRARSRHAILRRQTSLGLRMPAEYMSKFVVGAPSHERFNDCILAVFRSGEAFRTRRLASTDNCLGSRFWAQKTGIFVLFVLPLLRASCRVMVCLFKIVERRCAIVIIATG